MALTIDELQIEIQAKAAEASSGIEALTTSLGALKRTVNKSLIGKLGELSSALDSIKAPITVNMNVKGMDELKSAVNAATADASANMDRIKASTEQAAGSFETISSEATKVKNELKSTGDAAGDAGKKLKEVGESAKKGAGGLNKFVSSLKRIALYRAIRFILKNITSAIKEGTQNLVRYSAAIGGIDASRANETMSRFASMGMQVKNTLGAALMPVLKALMPVIQTIANWFMTAANAVNQFLAAISGATSFTKAKEVWVDYAEGLDGAANAADNLKNAVLGMDELNVLAPTGGIKSLVPDYSDMFEEVEVDDKISAFADKIKPILTWVKENLETIKWVALGIGTAMLLWKVGPALISGIGWLLSNLPIILGTATLIYGAFDAIANGVDWNNLTFMISGMAAAVAGLALVFGTTAAGIGLIVGGIALLAIGFMDITKNGLNLQNTLLILAGTFSTGLGMSLLTGSIIPLVIAGLALVVGGIVDIINNGVTLENSLLVISGIMLTTVAIAIKAVISGMATLGITIGLVGLAVASLVGAFLYISSVWDMLSGLEKAATIFTGLAAAVLAAALAIAVFHAAWSVGLAVGIIVGALAAVTVAFASVKNDIDKTASTGVSQNVGRGYPAPSSPSPNAYMPQYQASTHGGVTAQSNQQPSMDSKEIISLLQQLVSKDTNLYVDGARLNQALDPHQQQYGAQRGTVLVR